MSAPTIVDGPLEPKPLVKPEWTREEGGCLRLRYVGVNGYAGIAAEVTKETVEVYPPGMVVHRCMFEVRKDRSLDECKRICEQALRDAGYRFVGELVITGRWVVGSTGAHWLPYVGCDRMAAMVVKKPVGDAAELTVWRHGVWTREDVACVITGSPDAVTAAKREAVRVLRMHGATVPDDVDEPCSHALIP